MSGNTLNLVIAAGSILIGGVVSFYFYWISRKERRPVYVVTGNVVVRSDEDWNIEVRYSGQVVPVVSRTIIGFWNAGREPIRSSDVVPSHPIAASFPPSRRLESTVLATTRPEIDFKIRYSEITFSYLNHNDGESSRFSTQATIPWR